MSTPPTTPEELAVLHGMIALIADEVIDPVLVAVEIWEIFGWWGAMKIMPWAMGDHCPPVVRRLAVLLG